MLDLKIINALLIDGTGAPAREANLGLRDGIIVSIGEVAEDAIEILDVEGLVVSPGFIDIHTHYDAQAFWDPTLTPSSIHGVTTVIAGHCGFSIAPMSAEAAAYLKPMLARVEGMPLATLDAGVPWDWQSFGEFLDRLEGTLSLNAGFMVGHSAIRRVVMGERANEGPANDADVQAMRALLSTSISEGALGFSTTVSPSHNDAAGGPVPSRFAERSEILALASVVADHDGTSLELLPDLKFDDATISLLTEFSLAGQRPVNWNLLSVAGADQTSRDITALQLSASDHARSHGATVVALVPPCTPTTRINLVTGFIFDALPGWAPIFQMPHAARVAFLRVPAVRAVLANAAATERGVLRHYANWSSFLVVEGYSDQTRAYEGRLIGDIAEETGAAPFDTFLDIALADDLHTSFLPQVSGEDQATYDVRGEIWKDDRTIVGGSDAGAHLDMIDSFAFSTKLLQKAREYGVMTLEEAVRQLTSVPAALMGLRGRGELREGHFADLVVFDPVEIACGPVFTKFDLPGTQVESRLYAEASGIRYVIVNGSVAVQDGEPTSARAGTIFRSGRDTQTVSIPAAHGN